MKEYIIGNYHSFFFVCECGKNNYLNIAWKDDLIKKDYFVCYKCEKTIIDEKDAGLLRDALALSGRAGFCKC